MKDIEFEFLKVSYIQFYQFKMQKKQCIGCMKTFQQGFKLPLEDLSVELKMYYLPIKDQMHKFIILKTIISFLNSKGGTIFIGAEDKTGQVIGIPIDRKQQDQFKLFIQLLVQKIQPQVDLSNREDVIVQFVPVNKAGVFTGRYLGKIIIKQGQTSKLYCFSQKIQLQSANDKKYDEFEVVYSFKRMNMGSVKKITGYDVIAQSTARTLKPPLPVNIFHQGCNPQPQYIPSQASISDSQAKGNLVKQGTKSSKRQQQAEQQSNYSLQFFKVRDHVARQLLENKLDELLTSIKIKWFIISYDQENDTLLIEFANKKQWMKSMDFIDSKLDVLNEAVKGIANFAKKQSQEDYAMYENQRPFNVQCINAEVCQLKQESPQKKQANRKPSQQAKQEQQQMITEEIPPQVLKKVDSIQEQIKNKQKEEKQQNKKQKGQQYQINLMSERKKKQSLFASNKFIALPSSVNIDKVSVLTITHLNPAKKEELKNFVNGLSQGHKTIDEYDKTLEFHFQNENDFEIVYDKLSKSKDLTKFGFRGVLRFGINTGQITMQNYDKKNYKQFKEYITKLVGPDVKRCQFTKKGDKYSLLLTINNPQKSAKWLDKLIQDKELKNFRVPNNEALKMKIDLVCVKPTKIAKKK